jgi:hypothetical protein
MSAALGAACHWPCRLRTWLPPPRFHPIRWLPRLTVGSARPRAPRLQRAPEPAQDKGYCGTTRTYQAPQGLMGLAYLNHSYNY